MSNIDYPDIPEWVQSRIVGFFNNAHHVSSILDGSVRDDPSDGPGSTIGPGLAARILRERNARPNRRFDTLADIDLIRGVGAGTIQDLVFSFGQSADEAFKSNMYSSGTIYESNWPLHYFRYAFDDREEFLALANNQDDLRTFLAERVQELSEERNLEAAAVGAMTKEIVTGYMDRYDNGTPVAGYALALWFYEFDADNWFSWEQIERQTAAYFNCNRHVRPWLMELIFIKGFTNRGLVRTGIAPEDLPVVVNHAEQAISFWVSVLYD